MYDTWSLYQTLDFDVWHKAEAYFDLGKDLSYACCFSHIIRVRFINLDLVKSFSFIYCSSDIICVRFVNLGFVKSFSLICCSSELIRVRFVNFPCLQCAPLSSHLQNCIFIGIILYSSKTAGLCRNCQVNTSLISFHSSVWLLVKIEMQNKRTENWTMHFHLKYENKFDLYRV